MNLPAGGPPRYTETLARAGPRGRRPLRRIDVLPFEVPGSYRVRQAPTAVVGVPAVDIPVYPSVYISRGPRL